MCDTTRCAASGAAIGASVLLAAVVGVAIFVLVHLVLFAPDLPGAKAVKSCDVAWNNGDIILTQHHAYHLKHLPILRYIPVHVGIVWMHPTFGPCIVDTHEAHRQDEQMPDALSNTRPRAGTRVVRMAEYLAEYDGLVFRRPVVRGGVDAVALGDAVMNWALYQPFDPWVSHPQPAFVAAVGLSTMVPTVVSRGIAALPGPSHDEHGKRQRGVYCTELVAKLLQRAGALDPAFCAYLCSPLAFTSTVKKIDKAALHGLAWGPEQRLVYSVA